MHTPYTPVANTIAPLQRMKEFAIKNGWQVSAQCIQRTIDEIKNSTF